MHQVEEFRETIFAEREIRVAKAGGVSVMRQVGEGGIFASLYRLAKEADTGLVVDLKAMPVRQKQSRFVNITSSIRISLLPRETY